MLPGEREETMQLTYPTESKMPTTAIRKHSRPRLVGRKGMPSRMAHRTAVATTIRKAYALGGAWDMEDYDWRNWQHWVLFFPQAAPINTEAPRPNVGS